MDNAAAIVRAYKLPVQAQRNMNVKAINELLEAIAEDVERGMAAQGSAPRTPAEDAFAIAEREAEDCVSCPTCQALVHRDKLASQGSAGALREGEEVWVKGVIERRHDTGDIEGYLVMLHDEEEHQWFERAALAAAHPAQPVKVLWHATNDSREGSTGRVYTDPLMQQAYDEGFEHGAAHPAQAKGSHD